MVMDTRMQAWKAKKIGMLLVLCALTVSEARLSQNLFAAKGPWNVTGHKEPRQDLLNIMFTDTADMRRYQDHCGYDWHQLFEQWEKRQYLAINHRSGVKSVVWRCEEHCGGLGDRWRGLLTSFMLALVTHRTFFIDNEKPVPLRNYFAVANPALHWVFDDIMVKNKTVLHEHIIDSPSIGDYAGANLSQYDQFDVIIQRNTFYQPFHILKNHMAIESIVNKYEDHTLAGCILNYLLVPAKSLQQQVQNTRNNILETEGEIIGVHIRTGDGQTKDTKVVSGLVEAFDRCVQAITKDSQLPFRVFLTTDFDNVTSMMQATHLNLLTFDGPQFHIDGEFGSPTNLDKAVQKVVLDHLMISYSNRVIISRSGFAELAVLRSFRSYFTPVNCHVEESIQHYRFPRENPRSVPSMPKDVESVFSVWDDSNT